MRSVIYIIICCALLFTACDVHEFPEQGNERVPFTLHLDFSTEMPLHKEVTYTRSGESQSQERAVKHDIRYLIKAYRTDNIIGNVRKDADTTIVFTRSDINNLNFTANIELYEGTYDIQVWADYVPSGTRYDYYYNTEDFNEIILPDKDNHIGSNDYRDAFRGSVTAKILNPKYYTGEILNTIENKAKVSMVRPMGKFKFISTDITAFITRVEEMLNSKSDNAAAEDTSEVNRPSIQMEDFKVVFRYNIFMPCSFNMFTDKPADSWMGMSFASIMQKEGLEDVMLGFDYVFVNGSETTLSVSLDIYTNDGEYLTSSDPINVPIARSKLTIVKGAFLTSKASGGITIQPGFDDEYNIEL